MEKYLLGIDVGTTGTKTILFSSQGRVIANDYMAYKLDTPRAGYSEQRAQDWWEAIVKTVRAVCSSIEAPEQVMAISVSSQGGTVVPVDEKFFPLRKAIVWNDVRCIEEAKEFEEHFGSRYLYETSGWHLGRGLNALQILWLRKNEPEVFKQASMFLAVPDYISARMTGIPAVDLSNAGIQQLVNINTKTYDKKILKFLGITPNHLGKLVHSGEVIGHLQPQAAKELGLTEETVLVAGAHDQYAVAVGAGCIQPGDILIGTGTAWVITAISDCPDFKHDFCQSIAATNGMWGSMISMSAGGVSLEWARRKLVAKEEEALPSYEDINREAEKSGIGANGLFFFPYFSGRNYPYPNTVTKASILGLDLSHSYYDISRAIMEGVAFQIGWILESFQEQFSPTSLKLTGGAAKSMLWSRIVADIVKLPVKIPEIVDLACVGAAVLAGVGCGIYKNAEEGYAWLKVQEHEIIPNYENIKKYRKLFEDYKQKARQLDLVYDCSKL